MSDTQAAAPATPAPAAPAQSRNERVQAAIKEAIEMEQKAAQPAEPAKAPEAAKAAPTSAPAEAPPKAEDKSFEKLLREKAALRPYAEAAKHLPVETLANVAKAHASKDPMAVLQSLGYSWEDVAKRAASQSPPDEAPAEGKVAPDNEAIMALKQEVEQLRAEREAEKTAAMSRELLARAKDVVKGKFKYLESMDAHEQILNYIQMYHAKTGSLPGESFEDSVELAAKAVESRFEQEAERWRKVLTPSTPATTMPVEAPGSAVSGTGTTSGKTLTNHSTSAPAAAVPKPTSREELFKQILSYPNAPW